MGRAEPMIDRDGWSGDGDFTAALLEALARIELIAVVRVQDAPESRADTGFNFVSNDVFVGFRRERAFSFRRVARLPLPGLVHRKSLTLNELAQILARTEGIGPADYQDDEMLQYLRAERVIPPYQTRGHKIVEMVRIFEAQPVGSSHNG